MKTKHTPTPWHTERHQRYIPHEAGGPGGSYEGVNYWFNLIVQEDKDSPYLRTPIAEVAISTEADANAQFITLACNHHEELVEALQKSLIRLEFYCNLLQKETLERRSEGLPQSVEVEFCCQQISANRALLTKLKG